MTTIQNWNAIPGDIVPFNFFFLTFGACDPNAWIGMAAGPFSMDWHGKQSAGP